MSIRNIMSVVTQTPCVFRMPIRDNPKIAKADMADAEMERVCRLAGIDEAIDTMRWGGLPSTWPKRAFGMDKLTPNVL